MSREKFQKMLEDCIRTHTTEKDFVYKKNDLGMFVRLQPYTPDAITRAERAMLKQMEFHGTAWSEMNPATNVYKLVRSLLAYL